jgi:hypothetical protein
MDPVDIFKKRISRRLDVARRLGDGEAGGDYSDACSLIAAVISGIAADLWPGRRIDRVRFIETWVRYSSTDPFASRISVPLLSRRLRKEQKTKEAEGVEAFRPSAFGPANASKILLGEDVDATESELVGVSSILEIGDLRDRSYPSVFYEHVRSALVHEDHLDSRATAVAMTDRDALVSYGNLLTEGVSQRRIHFHLPWLLSLARTIAEAAADDLQSAPRARPTAWWVTG